MEVALITHTDYFAPVLIGYRETVIQDDVRANRFIEEKLEEISVRCRDLQRLSGQQHSEFAAP